MYRVVLIALLLLSGRCLAGAPASNGGAYVSIGGFSESFNDADGERSGLELSAMADVSKHFAVRVSGLLYEGTSDSQYEDDFGGYSLSGYYHFDAKYMNPYIGIGVFSGSTWRCSDYQESYDSCDEDYVLAAYPEIGIALNLGPFHVYPFVRRYIDTNNDNNKRNAYGLHLGLKLGGGS